MLNYLLKALLLPVWVLFFLKAMSLTTMHNNLFITYRYSHSQKVRLTKAFVIKTPAEWTVRDSPSGLSTAPSSGVGLFHPVSSWVPGCHSGLWGQYGVYKMLDVKGIRRFSFDDFNFNDFSFDTGFNNSYSVRVNERNFNYIMFRFISDSDTDCIINKFTAIYKINKSNRGVR